MREKNKICLSVLNAPLSYYVVKMIMRTLKVHATAEDTQSFGERMKWILYPVNNSERMKRKSFNQNVRFSQRALLCFFLHRESAVRAARFIRLRRKNGKRFLTVANHLSSPIVFPQKSNAAASKVHARGHARKFLGFANFCVRFVRSFAFRLSVSRRWLLPFGCHPWEKV